jgi:chromosome segregation ATPase
MAEMNELLEEAAVQCGALSDELDGAVSGIDGMVRRATELWETVARGGEQLQSRLRQLGERLDSAETALEGARAEAVGDLDRLATQAEAVRASVGELLGHVREGLEELEQLEGRASETIDEQAQAVATDYGDLGQRVQETQEAISTQLGEAGQALEAFRDAIVAARTELAQKRDRCQDELDDLETTAQEQTRAWVAGLQSVLADQTTAMIDMTNRMLDHHNATMEAVKTKFATEAALQVAASIQPLQNSLEALGELAAARATELSARSEESLQRVRAAVPVLEELRRAFEQSSRIGQGRS